MKEISDTMKAISLFSNLGGDTLGLELAGVSVVGFIEKDKHAISSHMANFPHSKLIKEDIYDVSLDDLKEYTNIDILFGGFPCQSFSHAGKKRPDDARGHLYKEFARIAGILKPRFVIGENVKGILTRKKDDGTLILHDILDEFKEIGYDLQYKIINTSKFGVPQKRERVIFIGSLNTNTPINIVDDINTSMTLRDILEDSLENAIDITDSFIDSQIPLNKYKSVNNVQVSGKPPSNLIKCFESQSISFAKRSKPTYSCVEDIDGTSHTLLCTYSRMPRLFVPIQCDSRRYLRPYTIKEMLCIQGFPDDFIVCGKYNSQVVQIGNAIPPPVVKEIVKGIKV